MSEIEVSPQVLLELLAYDKDTGFLIWKKRDVKFFRPRKHSADRSALSWNNKNCGKEAGRKSIGGIGISIFGKRYLAHRIVWAICYGEWPNPETEIDHINCDPFDNLISNLRLATRAQNEANKKKYKNNTSGFKGVLKSRSKWKAQRTVDGRPRHIGTFSTPEEAHSAYLDFSRRLHGNFARG